MYIFHLNKFINFYLSVVQYKTNLTFLLLYYLLVVKIRKPDTIRKILKQRVHEPQKKEE